MDLDAAFLSLRSIPALDPAICDRLRGWIAEAPDADLYRVNLVPFAEKWAVALPAAITHFLHLTKAGVMDLSWDIHCPRCNVIVDRASALEKASGTHFCKYCLDHVESRLDDHFEVTFTLSAGVRAVNGRVRYEPSKNVEIFLRTQVDASGAAEASLAVPPHARTLRFVSWPPVVVKAIPVAAAATSADVVFHGGESVRFPAALPAGPSTLRLRNETATSVGLMIENHEMREYEPHERGPRLTGLQVVSVPAFRELFASETLSLRESLKVRDVTLVFTDLGRSTALYQAEGDVRAYQFIRDHYDVLFAEIYRGEGTVVKTIGDAVMASFPAPDRAVAAMLAAGKSLSARLESFGPDRALSFRAGIHRGPVLAVNLNDRLDFFGTTVNEAARIEQKCGDNEIILSEVVAGDDAVRALTSAHERRTEEVEMKGLRGVYRLTRITC